MKCNLGRINRGSFKVVETMLLQAGRLLNAWGPSPVIVEVVVGEIIESCE